MKRLTAVLLWCVAGAVCAPAAAPEQSKTFHAEKGGTLDVSLQGGNIVINAWDRDEVVLRVRDADDDDEPALTMTQTGNRIQVEQSGDGSDDFTLEVSVPSRFDIRLRSSSGDFEINGPLTGRIKGSTGGGNIRLGNLGGTVALTTSGGDITSGDIGGDLDLSTAGGDIHMGKVTGTANVSTSGGDIVVADVGKRINASTSGGNISIGNVGGEAVASTSGGDIVAGSVSGSATLSTAGGNVSLRGATGSAHVTSSGGDLELENITGSLEGSTAGGNVVATLNPGKNGRSHLSTAGGDIRLLVPERARATINARISVRGWWRKEIGTCDIRSDFPMENYEKDERNHEIRARVVLNGGGEEIALDAVSGNIEIRKAGR